MAIPRNFFLILHKTEEPLIFWNIGLYNFSPDKSQEKNIAHTLPRKPAHAASSPPNFLLLRARSRPSQGLRLSG
jgi:hypothetical protein